MELPLKEQAMIQSLKIAYSRIKTISIDNANRLEAILNKADSSLLAHIIKERIPFCQSKAMRILVKRGLMTPDDQWNLAIDIVGRNLADKLFKLA